MKQIALVVAFVGTAAAQAPKQAVVEADVLLVGCAPLKVVCGRVAVTQPMAVKVTKVTSGPLKIGDAIVVEVLTCSPGPLLVASEPDKPFVELDPRQIRRGSHLRLALDVEHGAAFATTDKIGVVKP